MGQTIAVMITKGGVGKSTLVMAVAETLSVYHQKRILIIDSDSQSSVSSMLMPTERLSEIQKSNRTISELLALRVLDGRQSNWRDYVVENVSDVDDANTISLMPSHVQLALFEREVSAQLCFSELSRVVATLVREVNAEYDLVLVDCPPTLTCLTEAWMRQANYHLSPTKPDYLGLHGLEILNRFEDLSGEQGFSRRLGVLVNMMDTSSAVDQKFHEVLMSNRKYRCFPQAVPSHMSVKNSALFHPEERSFMSKYPGVGHTLRDLSEEVLARLGLSDDIYQTDESSIISRAV